MPSVEIQSNFSDDLRALLCARLVADHYQVATTDDLDAVLVQYLNVRHRRIEALPRNVEWSRELRASEPSLSAGYRAALARIEAASVAGGDLNPYLSRKLVKSATFNDGLLNDWAIQHMHLGGGLNARGVIMGTKDLLFVIAKPDALYFINVLDHDAFADEQLFKVAETNWPQLFRDVELNGIIGLEQEGLSSEERAKLRAAGINTFSFGASGAIYAPPGGGSMKNRLATDVRRTAIEMRREMRRRESTCAERGDAIVGMIAGKTGQALTKLRLKLEMTSDDQLRVVETTTGFVVLL